MKLILLTALSAMLAIATGFVFAVISNYFYLIILFSLGIGFILAIGGAIFVEKTKFHHPRPAMAVGFLIGTLGFLSIRFFHYRDFQREVHAIVVQKAPELAAADKQALSDLLLKRKVGRSGFPGYLLYRGNVVGAKIKSVEIRGLPFWIIEFIEFFLIVLIPTLGFMGAAAKLFCTRCDRWFEEKTIFQTSLENYEKAIDCINRKDFESLNKLRHVGASELKTHLSVKLHHCPICNLEQFLSGELLLTDKEGKTSTKEVFERLPVDSSQTAPLLKPGEV